MGLRVLSFRVVRAAISSLFVLLLLAFSLLQFQEHRLRRRNERLLDDFHSIRLNETTWSEALALMQRWGNYGHSHGPCDANACGYEINITNWPSLLPNNPVGSWLGRLGRLSTIRQFVGLRSSILNLRFLVEDGAVRRTQLRIMAETQDAGYGSELFVTVRSRSSISASDEALRFVGADEELGIHPDFVVGPESFCSGCETISLTYTPGLTHEELVRLTSFTLSCLTDNIPCLHLSGLAPALMREKATYFRDVPRNSVPCTTPAWALARDASTIWLADTLGTGQVLNPGTLPGETPSVVEQDQIKLIKILKGPPKIAPQTVFRFRPYSGVEYEARAIPEHLKSGHRYILLPAANDYDWQKEGVDAWRCGVLDDTPENELAIQQGIAMNDHLRMPESIEEWPW